MRKIMISMVTAGLLLGGALYANEKAKEGADAKEVSRIAVSNAKQDAKTGKTKLVQEAIDSLKFAHEAYLSLTKKDTKKATQNLEKALGKLEVILSAEHAPKLLPIDSSVVVNEFAGNSKDVKLLVKQVQALLDTGKVQEARVLMQPLQSEIDITVVSLPLASYPDALRLAAKYIQSEKPDEAQKVLAVALNTFTEVTKIIPIPLLKATDLIAIASETAQKDPKRAVRYLEAASESLNTAEALGYVSRSETSYKMLHEKIDAVKKEVKGANKSEKLFDALKTKLKEFGDKVFSGKK